MVFSRKRFLRGRVSAVSGDGPEPLALHLDTGDSVTLRCRGALRLLCAPFPSGETLLPGSGQELEGKPADLLLNPAQGC